MKYDVIYADPCWKYRDATPNRRIENHYKTMDLKDLKNINIPAKKNSVLFLWATSPLLNQAFELINAWGFKYKTCLIWDKLSMGMGYWFRIQHEILLVSVKGHFNPPKAKDRIRSILKSKRREHSRKPDEIRTLINKWYPNKSKIEMFARHKFEGWDVWGDEIPEYTQKVLK